MDEYYKEYIHRVRDAVESSSALGRLSHWLTKHTTLAGKKFSFKDHEYQEAIVDSTHPNQAVKKPSQVGLSELTARLILGFLAVSPDTVGIYTLPTVNEALRFAKSRMDPVIKGSKYLSNMISPGNDSSSFKQLGSSQLFMAGTFGKALISIPTDLLVNDELDFSNPEVIATAESRLSHSRFFDEILDIRGIRRKFSTPTVPGVGVSDLFDKSDKRYRLVKCKHCGHWFWPNFLVHVVVQGYDRIMDEITYAEVLHLDSRGLIETAQLLCEKCHGPITRTNLGAEYRDWVAERPHVRHVQGFQVSPFDLPAYHSPASLLRKKLEFKEEEGHFRNFSLGIEHSDASNSILPNAVKDNTTIRPQYPDSTSAYGCVMGLDVGKTSWLLVGKPMLNPGTMETTIHVFWAEQVNIRTGEEDILFETVVERIKQFRVSKIVCDSLPYTDTIIRICKRFPTGLALPCMYVLTDRKLPPYIVKNDETSVDANRTKTINSIVRKVNNNQVKFAKFPDIEVLEKHLQGMKRVDRILDDGSVDSQWVKSGPDHYFHALNYLNMAADMVGASIVSGFSPGVGIVKTVVGKNVKDDRVIDPLHLFNK